MYENFYNFQAKPFRLSPDPGFYYASRGHKRALAYLRYGLAQGEGFVVITGAPGTGKTTLAQILLKEMDLSEVVVAHLTTTQLEAEDMLRMVAASFGLRFQGTDKAALLKLLENFLLARSRESKRALLVVDEAQNLPASSLEELRMLSNLQVGGQALLQTFLLGQYQFRQMLDHPDLEQLNQRVIANYHLGSLALDECKSYVESRLTQVGWKNDPHITDTAYDIIYRHTEGVPRRINMLCDRVLLFSCLEERHEINEAALKEVTDELQNEVSGSPVPLTSSRVEVSPEPIATPQKSGAEETTGHVHHDVVEELEARASEVARDAARNAEQKKQAEKNLRATETEIEKPATGGDLVPNETGGGNENVLDRVSPDDGWNRLVAEAQPEHIDVDDGSVQEDAPTPNKAAEKDRFRVIVGGKQATSSPYTDNVRETVRPANHPAPAVKAPVPVSAGDSEEVVLRKILRLVLAFHRSPRSFPGLDDPAQPLPPGIQAILKLAVSEDKVLADLRQISVMGISPAMLRAAARFFVRRVMFFPGSDDYRVLGLPPQADAADIETHYGLLMRLLRQEKESDREVGVARIGTAYERLCRAHSPGSAGDRRPVLANDLDDVEDLDLDLAPSAVGSYSRAARGTEESILPLAVDDGPTAPTKRNVALVIGAIVVGVVLYLTQFGSNKTELEEGGKVLSPEPKSLAQVDGSAVVDSSVAPVGDAEPEKREAARAGQVALAPTSSAAVTPQNDDRISAATAPEVGPVAQTDSADFGEASSDILPTQKTTAEVEIEKELASLKAAAAAELRAKAEAEARMQAVAAEKARLEAKIAASVKKQEATARKRKLQQAAEARAIAEAKRKAAAEAKAARVEAETIVASRVVIDSGSQMTSLAEADAQSATGVLPKKSGRSTASQKTTNAGVSGEQPSVASVPIPNGKLSVVTPDVVSSKAAAVEKKATVSAEISQPELNALVGSMIESYEDGDIEAFMSLFAKNAQSNDRATVAGIRKDYQELFDNTLLRFLQLQKLVWKKDGSIVRGEGRYVVEVQTTGRGKIDTYEGDLWIQVERRDGAAKITHFAFFE
ncbi:MAG: AAA family ATPase [Gammaproteobacteria bacterium]|nr:AAA family ATPase [Gammaproteobacteria bacterium]